MKKKIKYVLVLVFLFFVFSFNCFALTYGGCEYSEIARLKSIVSNVNITYDYRIIDNQAYFDITINNIVSGIYFIDSKSGIQYDYWNTNDGEITISGYTNTSGHYKFYSALNECYGVKLVNKYYTLPTYNFYYDDPLCDENRAYALCQKWKKVNYTYKEFSELINSYNSNEDYFEEEEIEPSYSHTYMNDLIQFYIKYYPFILVGIILICVIIMIINNKKNKFDL